jgi:predicted cobalt transporter CbtA
MNARLGLGASLKAALLAAVVAALLATTWHWVVTEPLIDAAIELEQAHHDGEAAESVVSRPTQRLGLGLALLLYGVSWALALGGLFSLIQAHLPGGSVGRRAALLGGLAGWTFALLPFLKYPASPPGVGDPDTIGVRQMLYFGILALGVLGAAGTLFAGRRLSGRGRTGWPIALVGYAVYCLVLYLVLPPNPDPTPIPADLLAGFRLRSGLGLVLYWFAFAVLFGMLVERWSAPGRHAVARGSVTPL